MDTKNLCDSAIYAYVHKTMINLHYMKKMSTTRVILPSQRQGLMDTRKSQMAASGGSDLRAPIFNGDNYEFWKIRMRTIFKSHRIWDLTSKSAWDILHQEFHGDKQVRSIKLQSLRCDFEYTRIRDDETLSMYLTHLLELVNQMKSYGEDLPRERLVHKLLISLTKEFDPVCYVIEQTKDIETIEVQEVIAALRGFAQLLDRHAESITERAFNSMSVNPKGTQSNPSFGNSKRKKN
ncbi:unnamed protein product [Malus baccata var. baccata]